jgi:hypothetical protein
MPATFCPVHFVCKPWLTNVLTPSSPHRAALPRRLAGRGRDAPGGAIGFTTGRCKTFSLPRDEYSQPVKIHFHPVDPFCNHWLQSISTRSIRFTTSGSKTFSPPRSVRNRPVTFFLTPSRRFITTGNNPSSPPRGVLYPPGINPSSPPRSGSKPRLRFILTPSRRFMAVRHNPSPPPERDAHDARHAARGRGGWSGRAEGRGAVLGHPRRGEGRRRRAGYCLTASYKSCPVGNFLPRPLTRSPSGASATLGGTRRLLFGRYLRFVADRYNSFSAPRSVCKPVAYFLPHPLDPSYSGPL